MLRNHLFNRFLFLCILLFPGYLWAGSKEPDVPPHLDFVKTIELQGYVQSAGRDHRGAQDVLVRTCYLDPEVKAFVGMVGSIGRFNDDFHLDTSSTSVAVGTLWNWGADVGLVRGRHKWELDLMGANLGDLLGFAAAIEGEHTLGPHWTVFHRTAVDLFTGLSFVDATQGVAWHWKTVGLSVGYRFFASRHLSRNGPFVGMILRFDSPRLPFIFPSIG